MGGWGSEPAGVAGKGERGVCGYPVAWKRAREHQRSAGPKQVSERGVATWRVIAELGNHHSDTPFGGNIEPRDDKGVTSSRTLSRHVLTPACEGSECHSP